MTDSYHKTIFTKLSLQYPNKHSLCMGTGNPAWRCPLHFYLLEVKIFLLFKYGGKEAVKLEEIVIVVSNDTPRSDLCKKRGQLASILVKICVLKFENLKKVFIILKVFSTKKLKKRIWGQDQLQSRNGTNSKCVPLSDPGRFWFVLSNLLCSTISGWIVSFLFLIYSVNTQSWDYKCRAVFGNKAKKLCQNMWKIPK